MNGQVHSCCAPAYIRGRAGGIPGKNKNGGTLIVRAAPLNVGHVMGVFSQFKDSHGDVIGISGVMCFIAPRPLISCAIGGRGISRYFEWSTLFASLQILMEM